MGVRPVLGVLPVEVVALVAVVSVLGAWLPGVAGVNKVDIAGNALNIADRNASCAETEVDAITCIGSRYRRTASMTVTLRGSPSFDMTNLDAPLWWTLDLSTTTNISSLQIMANGQAQTHMKIQDSVWNPDNRPELVHRVSIFNSRSIIGGPLNLSSSLNSEVLDLTIMIAFDINPSYQKSSVTIYGMRVDQFCSFQNANDNRWSYQPIAGVVDACMACPSGHTDASRTVCYPCVEGEYSLTGSPAQCTSCTTCDAWSGVYTPCTPTTDTVCKPLFWHGEEPIRDVLVDWVVRAPVDSADLTLSTWVDGVDFEHVGQVIRGLRHCYDSSTCDIDTIVATYNHNDYDDHNDHNNHNYHNYHDDDDDYYHHHNPHSHKSGCYYPSPQHKRDNHRRIAVTTTEPIRVREWGHQYLSDLVLHRPGGGYD
ncbi:uncharacterized protein MONBRDRAFT_11521 [Monosiga brevicollis MX1]|uniref:TNFR-Cys domain-containing protein n=1 Tax=Monosiga brevicollis TaxID=81824 RepID=A9V9E2_MONBE|nr:uncharacterized protein MONBRDRAFT_11521 [Monosiga brevicollis MX1]EDQ85914.1 predicted protein [Monosiga brevicollis MX1]|eukprot:XP_001749393.1 hypothetical protein [Monosiga brevicollis MX1]